MKLQYIGLDEINGPLVFLEGVKDVGFEEKPLKVLPNISFDNAISTG